MFFISTVDQIESKHIDKHQVWTLKTNSKVDKQTIYLSLLEQV